ncbi:FlgD immunoglobulin-like domain containing protein [Roseivirga sp. E12]|uniref:FlgD immunoglobulin-like domain containing protein n=1 Tax=Roseivirga sp. E12 TaxID=2819237 RepID=UPI001ABCEEA5|nr:FlgD immunoglobulin-like domain containing protein [Roseivirga sp. E12]MBO3700187.1 flagellar basal body rod modification protein [Roseivirga sp. E12]
MSNLKLQNYLLITVLFYVLFAITWSFIPAHEEVAIAQIIENDKSEIEGREDRQSRSEYERQLLANPTTGQIPEGIRAKELSFAAKNYRTQLLNDQRLQRSGSNSGSAIQALNWSQVGPNNFGGRSRAVVMDVRDENLMIAGGVSGGSWRSIDQGQNWTRTSLADDIQSVTAITQNIKAGQEDIWYYGTGELVGNSTRAPGAPFRGNGIFKSTDNGISWRPLTSTQSNSPGLFNSPFQYVWDITTNPNGTDDEVIAAVYGGIVRSVDGGQNWTTVLGNDLLNFPANGDLNDVTAVFYTDVHRTANNVLIASLSSVTNVATVGSPQAGVYSSTDGQNWTLLRNFANTNSRRIEIGSSPSNPDILYFIIDQGSDYGLFRYTMSTSQLINLSTNVPDGSNNIEAYDSQGSYDMFVSVHPTDPNVVFLGGTNIYRSTDAFSTSNNITWIGGYDPAENGARIYPNHHPDQHGVIFSPSNPDRMFSFNDGGIFVTEDSRANEVSYASLNNGFVTTQFYTGIFSQYPPDDFVIGGTQDNGSILTTNTAVNGADNGTRVLGGDGAFAATTPIGVFYYMSFQNSRIFRLGLDQNFDITSFARVDPTGGGTDPSQPYQFINPYTLDPNNANRMYLAGGDFLWRNRNLSQILTGSQSTTTTNWSRLDKTELSDGTITAVQVSTTPKNIVYYGTSTGRLFKVTDASTEVYEVEDITGTLFPVDGYIRSIAVDPLNADELLVSFSNYGIPSVFRSTNGGQSFEDVSGTLEENPSGEGNGPSVRWVTIVPLDDGSKLYMAATSTGLYSTGIMNGQSTNWLIESAEGIGNAVVNMIDYRRVDGKIVAATHGRGMFTSQIGNVEPPEPISGSDNFEISTVFPNPFSDLVTVRVNLPETNFVLIRIYDSSGNQIRTISSGLGFIGENEFFWDGTNTLGNPVPDGIYLIRITHLRENTVRRVILTRQ